MPKGLNKEKNSVTIQRKGVKNMEMLAEVVTDFLLKKRYITAEEKEVCRYGYAVLFSNLLGLFIIAIMSVLTGRIADGIVFAVVFVTTRKYSGGYHANTYLRCKLTVACVYCFYLILSAAISEQDAGILCIMYILYMLCVIEKSPVENKNKPLDDEEKIKYHKISIMLGIVWGILSVIAGLCAYRYAVMVITTLFCVAGLILVASKTTM